MDIRQENPPKKPLVQKKRPSTALIYKKLKKNASKARKAEPSGEIQQRTTAVEHEGQQVEQVAEQPASREQGPEVAAPSPRPAALPAGNTDPSGTFTEEMIPVDILRIALASMKRGENLAVLMAEKKPAETSETLPTTLLIPQITEAAPTPPLSNEPPPVQENRAASTPVEPFDEIPASEPIDLYIPTQKGGINEAKGGSEEGEAARSSKKVSEGEKPTGLSGCEAVEQGVEVKASGEDDVDKGVQSVIKEMGTKVQEATDAVVDEAEKKAEKEQTQGPGVKEVLTIEEEDSPVKEQETRRKRVSRRLSEIEAEKQKRSKESKLEEQTRPGPRIKRAHTAAEIPQFDDDKAESNSAGEAKQGETEPEEKAQEQAEETEEEAEEAERKKKRNGKVVGKKP